MNMQQAREILTNISNLNLSEREALDFVFNKLDMLTENLGTSAEELEFLSNLSALPISDEESDTADIKKLNEAVRSIRNNSNIWLSTINLSHEIWRDVVGYEKLYHVSNFGRIKSFYNGKIHILKGTLFSKGYRHVSLSQNGKIKYPLIHVIVATAFIPNPEGKLTVNHQDGDKENCCIWNLKWMTHKENIRHAFDTGLQKSGCKHHNARLTLEQRKYILEHCIPYDEEFGVTALAKKFGVHSGTISRIFNGQSYKNDE